MRIALIEPFAGIAGDMLVGALVHAGAPFLELRAALDRLALPGVAVTRRDVLRGGVAACKFVVEHEEQHHHRGLAAILERIEGADLPGGAAARAAAAFTRLADAEARIHGLPVEEVHFHEVGAVDSICDLVGAAVALELLGVERVFCRALPLSTGTVRAAHGLLPVPAPATLELLRGRPVRESGLEGELVTPTGAAMVAAWAEPGGPPPFTPTAIGYGAGDRDPDGYPNVTRVVLGDAESGEAAAPPLLELACDVDDATPQVLGHLLARLLEAGALDATLSPLVMKKDRPGTRVTVLARAAAVPAIETVLFTEGTTLGVRRHPVARTELPRRTVRVETEYGPVRLKLGSLGDRVVHVAPEYEDCRALARERGVALREVVRAAMAQWRP
jgi:uncharacterized protein (TIGR00299 family) protein